MRVGERAVYEHVGTVISIFSQDTSGITTRLTKVGSNFNALTGLGIRKSGLTMATCNIIFWSIVVPVSLYGCEVWCLSNESVSELENFQNYTCMRIQRFHLRVPNVSSLYSLGWIQIRKLMFVRSVMVMKDEEVAKVVCVERAKSYNLDEVSDVLAEWSIVHDILSVTSLFGLETEIRNMIDMGYFHKKSVWKRMLWNKAWSLKNINWCIEVNLRSNLD